MPLTTRLRRAARRRLSRRANVDTKSISVKDRRILRRALVVQQAGTPADEESKLARLKVGLLSLPLLERDVFVLIRFGGMSTEEVAEMYGRPTETIINLVARALTKLARAAE